MIEVVNCDDVPELVQAAAKSTELHPRDLPPGKAIKTPITGLSPSAIDRLHVRLRVQAHRASKATGVRFRVVKTGDAIYVGRLA